MTMNSAAAVQVRRHQRRPVRQLVRRLIAAIRDNDDRKVEEAVLQLAGTRRIFALPEALLAKGSLESAGIQAYLVDDNMIRMDWFISNLLGGIKLKVRAEDAEVASEILNQPIPEVLDVEGVGDFQQPKCPRCQSLDVTYVLEKCGWTCDACGNEWEEPTSIALGSQFVSR